VPLVETDNFRVLTNTPEWTGAAGSFSDIMEFLDKQDLTEKITIVVLNKAVRVNID